ncbi:hypothetical protein [Pseudidiomarina terrestris]|uniref:Uncharacterized protein n=1 Tax=Pseudidiomarina terrestris TaxID=2820060 RepID=A0AAW7QZA2_9GAMM|nr:MULTISPECIES: hypothetical protein [unclassified Pseudidiomarina]MDN7124203.1 hypothetical protein [Pseudidiomarina sp. 1APP75-32.1]MDN7127270.1 hypothetical protein [Pseudidiomarina sp. 1APR75-33.1]MDN7128460.1 hypothetical protein [Pseudidiomarina sp. 1APR75-15]MDN7135292.1 hypothetical protein [Pseudidiomarina sp. 1ASP75-5]MDN7138649.1 hypothetical protein [Pseudidiomarina sp. 1ASP75-14]
MSKLDKDQVLADFTAAYEKAHGKKPTIEASSGWYSVDGGKNMRLAQLAEEAKTLVGGSKPAAAKAKSKPAAKAEKQPTAKVAKKPASKRLAENKSTAKKSASSGGLTARELWREKLEQGSSLSRLPRGF